MGWVYDLGCGELGNAVAVVTLCVLKEYHRRRSEIVGYRLQCWPMIGKGIQAENAGPVRRPRTRAVVCEARVRDIGEGKEIARSRGKCNDGEEVGEECGNNEAGVKRNCRSLGVEGGELPASRLFLGGDTIEMSYDNEISVASEDAGDEEATKEDDARDERAAKKQCGDGNKRKGCADRNDVNDNV
ncbi:hypothetical protein Cgig2_012352 [Carnegiea gigantea]|uniref:Uncharacterized protein n=1 Tax=Carnegiea gigantea TaxID=171969 RepID=A0A9Q1QKF9_9CARY|nr:hypothetical protein Cgig2_012352 [Carnegiea gigantea]